MKRLLAVAALLALAGSAHAQSDITPEQCQKLNSALASNAYEVVRLGALVAGYTEEQLRWAIARCGSAPKRKGK